MVALVSTLFVSIALSGVAVFGSPATPTALIRPAPPPKPIRCTFDKSLLNKCPSPLVCWRDPSSDSKLEGVCIAAPCNAILLPVRPTFTRLTDPATINTASIQPAILPALPIPGAFSQCPIGQVCASVPRVVAIRDVPSSASTPASVKPEPTPQVNPGIIKTPVVLPATLSPSTESSKPASTRPIPAVSPIRQIYNPGICVPTSQWCGGIQGRSCPSIRLSPVVTQQSISLSQTKIPLPSLSKSLDIKARSTDTDDETDDENDPETDYDSDTEKLTIWPIRPRWTCVPNPLEGCVYGVDPDCRGVCVLVQ